VNANHFFPFIFWKTFLAMDAAKFFPPENTTSAFYKFSIVRENSAQRQRHKKKNQGVTKNKIKQSKKKKTK